MQEASGVRDRFIATGAQLVADILTSLLSRRWGMEDSFPPERTLNRGERSRPEGTRNRQLRQPQTSMRSEEKRIETFLHWRASAPVSPVDLSAAGFFFIGPEDRVKCFCCGGELYDWVAEDDPMVEHLKFFPACPFIQGKEVGNQPIPRAEDIQDSVDGQLLGMLQSLGVEEATVDGQPEYTDMETEGDRLMTFENWPNFARVSPGPLARAGFFYIGEGDYVRCFYCDGALRNWARGDDPWVEHARWFPRCKFLLQSRGRDFVNSIQESYLGTPVSPEASLYQPEQHPASPREPAQTEQDPWRIRRETQHPNEPESSSSMEANLRRLQEERMCKVCMDKDVSIVLVPCGHLVVCAECAPNLRRCPICRGVIRDTMKAFLS